MVESLIPPSLRSGCIVDIGCGSHPAFLQDTTFSCKVGLDKSFTPEFVDGMSSAGFRLIRVDLDENPELPLESECCDVVTMTAVLEHFHPHTVPKVLAEIFRILKPKGICIFTTPPPWTHALLGIMARLKLVSSEEVEEHKVLYDVKEIVRLLADAGFPGEAIRGGYFELGMNCWASAAKSIPERGVR